MEAIREIDEFLKECISAGEFAGAVYLLAEQERIIALDACGHAVVVPETLAAQTDTIFDLASLTKPLITGMLLAQFIERGQISLTEPVSRILRQFDTQEKRAITIGQLATHSSGLAAWRPLYILAENPDRVIDIIAREPLAYKPGARVVYSDLGYIALGEILIQIGGKPLDELARQNIFEPLGLNKTCFLPPRHLRSEVAASETGNEHEKRLSGDLASAYENWRKEVIWGEVHDQNAFFLGGVAGHAGLFGPAREVYHLARQFLPGSRLLERALELFRENLTPGCEEGRSLGWVLASVGLTSAGPALPASSFGHTGFTGTSLWIDPESARIYILLTNRTHPVYKEFNMNERRRRFHMLAKSAFNCR
jgi:serine-type D-Ala-D-Ala carboxypeptidase